MLTGWYLAAALEVAVALELRGADLDRKIAALLEHTSQVAENSSATEASAGHAWSRTSTSSIVPPAERLFTRERHHAMALELRPNCEQCDVDLPPDSTTARICSYECTFCASCVDTVLSNVCPNCGGGFEPRPIRPVREWRPGLSLAKRPASTVRHSLSYSAEEIAALSERLRATPANAR